MHYTTKAMLMDAARNLPRTIYNLVSTAQLNPYEFQASLIRNLVLSMPQSEQDKYARECLHLRNIPLDKVNDRIEALEQQTVTPAIDTLYIKDLLKNE